MFTRGGIPKIVHKIWLGSAPLPDRYRALDKTWATSPSWKVKWWFDADVTAVLKYFRPNNVKAFYRSKNLGERSDVVRYEILNKWGGMYADTDVECLKDIDGLVDRHDVSFFVGKESFNKNENKYIYGNAVIGCRPGHPAMRDVVGSLYWEMKKSYEENVGLIWQIVKGSGPHFLTKVLDRHHNVTAFDCDVFYPGFETEAVRYYRGDKSKSVSTNSYLFHHWDNTWLIE
jgi:mannosyltransferase OCH1-like enzyme